MWLLNFILSVYFYFSSCWFYNLVYVTYKKDFSSSFLACGLGTITVQVISIGFTMFFPIICFLIVYHNFDNVYLLILQLYSMMSFLIDFEPSILSSNSPYLSNICILTRKRFSPSRFHKQSPSSLETCSLIFRCKNIKIPKQLLSLMTS